MYADSTGLFRLWLTDTLRRRRMSQQELARRCGIDRSTITRILNGERDPSLHTALRLVDALGAETTPSQFRALTGVVDRAAWVRRLLDDDELLDACDVDSMMDDYLARRNRRRSERSFT